CRQPSSTTDGPSSWEGGAWRNELAAAKKQPVHRRIVMKSAGRIRGLGLRAHRNPSPGCKRGTLSVTRSYGCHLPALSSGLPRMTDSGPPRITRFSGSKNGLPGTVSPGYKPAQEAVHSATLVRSPKIGG